MCQALNWAHVLSPHLKTCGRDVIDSHFTGGETDTGKTRTCQEATHLVRILEVLGSGPRTGKKYPKNAVLSQIRKASISLTWAPINEIYATLLPFNPPLEHWGDLPAPGLLLHCCPLLSKSSPGAWASGVPQSSLPVLHVGPADPVSSKHPTLSIFLYPPPWPKARPTGCLGFLVGPLVASTAAQKNLCSHGNYRLFKK